jgi:hypothetical protein
MLEPVPITALKPVADSPGIILAGQGVDIDAHQFRVRASLRPGVVGFRARR